jgi:Cu-Zn family superoxide dismutase
MNRRHVVVVALGAAGIAAAGVYGCSEDEARPPALSSTSSGGPQPDSAVQDTGADGPVYTARAEIRSTADAAAPLMGTATFTEQNGQVTVLVNMTAGFPPGGEGPRGMHIHQGNNCDPTDAGADAAPTLGGGAGGHWNPTDAGHGYPGTANHHLGDMGNVIITDAGTGTLTLTSTQWKVDGTGPSSVVGHAIIFHAQQDDGVSQPVGNAGARPGCGVITRQ